MIGLSREEDFDNRISQAAGPSTYLLDQCLDFFSCVKATMTEWAESLGFEQGEYILLEQMLATGQGATFTIGKTEHFVKLCLI